MVLVQLGRGAALLGAAAVVGACHGPLYDIDQMADPLDKARYSCQYLLERALAPEGARDPDGVLRRRTANFASPSVSREGDTVRVTWPRGAITRRADGGPHAGGCVMTLRPNGRQVLSVVLDGRAQPAGFGM